MTTRYKGFIVALDYDIREDDAEPILSALRLIKGVTSVHPVTAEMNDDMARARTRLAIGRALHDMASRVMKGEIDE